MKELCVILLCLFVVHSTSAGEKWAIVIGIGEYPADSGWKKINGDNDIEIIVPMLCKLGFPEDNIIKLANQSATKHGIKNAVYKDFIPKLHKGDIVYFHFSGHGQLITDLDGDEDDGWDEAMIPYDAKSKYDVNGYRGENHLVDDELNEWMLDVYNKIGNNGKLLIVLDACHSGGGSRDIDDDIEGNILVRGTSDRFEITPNSHTATHSKREVQWVCISACQSNERNYEYKATDGNIYGRLSWSLSEVLTPNMSVQELETAIKQQYMLMPITPSPQTVKIEYLPNLMNKPVL